MFLSDEQMAAVEHGSRGKPTFEWVDLPVGPQPLPDWARGLDVSWMDGYCNPPHYTVRTSQGLRDWPNKVFTKEGLRYLALSGDGRAECYYHSGELVWQELTRRRWSHVGMYAPGKLSRPYDPWMYSRGRYYWDEVYMTWATFKDGGFGGSAYVLQLDDGRQVTLRGPWHGPVPAGYVDVGGQSVGGSKWRASGAGCISEDLLCLLLAKHWSHCRVARITQGKRSWIEAVRPDWDVPKSVWLAEGMRRLSDVG